MTPGSRGREALPTVSWSLEHGPGAESRPMAGRVRHRWDVAPREAIRIQRRIAPKVCLHNDFSAIRSVAGADIALDTKTNRGFAALVRFSFPEMRQLEVVHAAGELRMPYVPGLLSFREAPLLIEAFQKFREKPDILMCDGQGYAHPRRLGIACHLGLLLGIPTIGCAKSRLVGEYVEPGKWRGSTSPLFHLGEGPAHARPRQTDLRLDGPPRRPEDGRRNRDCVQPALPCSRAHAPGRRPCRGIQARDN